MVLTEESLECLQNGIDRWSVECLRNISDREIV